MYEIRFKKDVEILPRAKFLPQSAACFDADEIDDYLMDLNCWRQYLSKYIATHFNNVDDYLQTVAYHKRLEFFFFERIPVKYINEIRCASAKTCSALRERLGSDVSVPKYILDMIKITENVTED